MAPRGQFSMARDILGIHAERQIVEPLLVLAVTLR